MEPNTADLDDSSEKPFTGWLNGWPAKWPPNPPPEIDENGKVTHVYYLRALPSFKILDCGSNGAVCIHPDRPSEAIKVPISRPGALADFEVEKRIYTRLGSHPNIVKCLRIEDSAIYLERAEHGCIRQYYREGGTSTMAERIKWSRDLANTLQYVHDHNIRHGDLGGKNLLLDSTRTIKLCDFAGSAIDDTPSTVWAQSGFRHPCDREESISTVKAEIHALGSTIFEIITNKEPHEGLSNHIVDQMLADGKYPDVTNVTLGDVITKCWKGEFESASEVAKSIDKSVQ
jgi:serine/threonine protein kinase